jgi:surface protein
LIRTRLEILFEGGEELHSKAETDTETIRTATVKADTESVGMNSISGSSVERHNVSMNEASRGFVASTTVISIHTSGHGQDHTGVPNDASPAKPRAVAVSSAVEATIPNVEGLGGAGAEGAGSKIGGGVVAQVRSGGRGAGETSPMADSAAVHVAACSEPSDSNSSSAGNAHVSIAVAIAMPVDVAAAVTVAVADYRSVISSMARANASNIITEENFYILQWLYRIRRASCARGLRAGFLRPDFLWSIYRPMMRSKECLRRTDGDIRAAVDLWCRNRAAVEERYGHISEWDVSSVTDMSRLFKNKTTFNDDISRWDVSQVTNMSYMLCNAHAFNQPVGDWDVSKVTNMSFMFSTAMSFNQPVGEWDVSNITDIRGMFEGAHAFNQGVGDWNVSKVTNMSYMFRHAQSFNQAVGEWDVSKVTDMSCMFSNAQSFNQPVGEWNVSKVTRMYGMFNNAQSFDQPVGEWDVSQVTNMSHMFSNVQSFNQDLTRWDLRSAEDTTFMFANTMQDGNKPASLRQVTVI